MYVIFKLYTVIATFCFNGYTNFSTKTQLQTFTNICLWCLIANLNSITAHLKSTWKHEILLLLHMATSWNVFVMAETSKGSIFGYWCPILSWMHRSPDWFPSIDVYSFHAYLFVRAWKKDSGQPLWYWNVATNYSKKTFLFLNYHDVETNWHELDWYLCLISIKLSGCFDYTEIKSFNIWLEDESLDCSKCHRGLSKLTEPQ